MPTYLQLVQQVEQAARLGYLRVGDQLPRVKDAVADLAINPRGSRTAGRPGPRRRCRRGPPPRCAGVMPAIATALAAWTGLAVVSGIWLRYHLYRAPLRFTSSTPMAELKLNRFSGRITVSAPAPARAYVMSSWWAGRDGKILQLAQIGRLGIHLAGIYQPDSRFWPFQWAETGWLAALSALLLAAAFYLSRRPHPLGPGLRPGFGRRAAAGSAGAGAVAVAGAAAGGPAAPPDAGPAVRTGDPAPEAAPPLDRVIGRVRPSGR